MQLLLHHCSNIFCFTFNWEGNISSEQESAKRSDAGNSNLFLIYGIMVSRQLHVGIILASDWSVAHNTGLWLAERWTHCVGVSRDNPYKLKTNTGCGDQKSRSHLSIGWEFSSLGFFMMPLAWSLVFVESFLATLVQNINFLVKSAEKVKWSGGGEHKREYFSIETNFG